MLVHGSQRMRWPEKNVGSIPGRGLEAYNSIIFGVLAKSCELRVGNSICGGVGRVWQGEGSGILLRDLDSTSKEVCLPHLGSSSLPRTLRTPPSTWSLPVSCLPVFLSSGFHHRNLLLLLSQTLSLCQQACTLPGPESHSQTPAASKLRTCPVALLFPALPPFPSTQGSALSPSPCFQAQLPRHSLSNLYMCRLWLSVIPRTPQTASHPFSLLLGLFITREPRIPFSKCLLIT